MKLRVVIGTVQVGQVEEVARRWEETVRGQMARLPEFRRALVGGDAEGDRFAIVTVWEQFPEPAVSRQMFQAFETRVADILAGPLEVEEYDVLVEV